MALSPHENARVQRQVRNRLPFFQNHNLHARVNQNAVKEPTNMPQSTQIQQMNASPTLKRSCHTLHDKSAPTHPVPLSLHGYITTVTRR
jgi:hypothetical protein